MGGSGRGGNNHGNRRRRSSGGSFSKNRERESAQSSRQEAAGSQDRRNNRKGELLPISEGRLEKNRGCMYERPRWSPPVLSAEPIPVPACPWCGKPITDLSAAIADKNSGEPVHFDCVIARIGEGEHLENGDAISYIGGGRFGIIHFNNPPDTRDFNIKKIFEWENKENRSEWRQSLSDHFSVT
jgi:hypothetical protein